MKKYILIGLAALLLAVAATLSVQHFNNYQKQETVKKQAVADKQAREARELAKLKADNAKLLASNNTGRIECEKGVASYDLLTPALKTKNPRPKCPAVVVL